MRTRNNVTRHRRRRRILKAARGYFGARKNLLRIAKDGVRRGRAYAYHGRKLRKRDFRSLWIQRINAAARDNGLTYSQLMGMVGKSGIALDRKSMADLAVSDPAAFTQVVEAARSAA